MINRLLYILNLPATNLLIGVAFVASALYEILSEVPEEIEQSLSGSHYALLLLGVLVVLRSMGEISEAVTTTSEKWERSNAPWFRRLAASLLEKTDRRVIVIPTAIFLLLGGGADAWEYFDTADTKGIATATMVILIGLSMLSFILLGAIEAVEKLDHEHVEVSSTFPSQTRSATGMLIIALIVFGVSVAEEMEQAREFFEFPSHRSAALWSGVEILKNIIRSASLAGESIKEKKTTD